VWQTEEATCFIRDILKVDEPATFADNIQQVAMLAGGGVRLMCS
jgi:hypothetical protein